ncbi:molecular chaperone [Serratia proteamaculans]|uniref:fimbrial biogenesis chaperone n=1 Tax=Serratia proteamaculans TaxID=28151 RepID=UPI001076764C|nr:molecular chaperone [Serratia proteamaculans]TFZ51994.1 molecular chaperone [Serratia proteamaculans]
MKLFWKSLIAVSLLATFTAAQAGIIVGATRVIYQEGSKEETLSVKNPEKDTPYMIQSWVENANAGQQAKTFVITPPIFKLDPGQETNLRIVYMGSAIPKDRESVFWLDVKSTPGTLKSEENQLLVSIKSRLKLFYRPAGMQGNSAEAYKQLKFSRQGNQLTVNNPTPYYVSFYSIKIGGNEIKDAGMVAPLSNTSWPLNGASTHQVTWQAITDFGDISAAAKSQI